MSSEEEEEESEEEKPKKKKAVEDSEGEDAKDVVKKKKRRPCQFGKKCYRYPRKKDRIEGGKSLVKPPLFVQAEVVLQYTKIYRLTFFL